MGIAYKDLARRIDHSLLGPTLTPRELEEGCHVAAKYQVASVCIKPHAVPLATRILRGTSVAVSTTIGFPHGGQATAVKLYETEYAIDEGATELDMVVNIGQALGGDWDSVRADIESIVTACHRRDVLLKVIFENCYLKPEHIIKLCQICGELRCDFVKTSTGYGTSGALAADLKLMREHSPPHVKLKAAGGVRTLDGALEMVALQCDRIGASKTAEILDEFRARFPSGT